jgi:RimJ/RimL family protein N-acetyltransferase
MNLRLEPLSLEHLPLVMGWVNDREVMQYFAEHQKPISVDDERLYLYGLIKSKNDKAFSIFDGDKYVGQCSLNAIYWPARSARLFIVIVSEEHNKGYGPEAIRKLLEIAFAERSTGPSDADVASSPVSAIGLNLHKVWLIVRKDNRNAQAMYLKLGFEFEGVLRDEYCVNGQYMDMVRMSVINERRP